MINDTEVKESFDKLLLKISSVPEKQICNKVCHDFKKNNNNKIIIDHIIN